MSSLTKISQLPHRTPGTIPGTGRIVLNIQDVGDAGVETKTALVSDLPVPTETLATLNANTAQVIANGTTFVIVGSTPAGGYVDWTLPDATTYAVGARLRIIDMFGLHVCNPNNGIQLHAKSGQTLNTKASTSFIFIQSASFVTDFYVNADKSGWCGASAYINNGINGQGYFGSFNWLCCDGAAMDSNVRMSGWVTTPGGGDTLTAIKNFVTVGGYQHWGTTGVAFVPQAGMYTFGTQPGGNGTDGIERVSAGLLAFNNAKKLDNSDGAGGGTLIDIQAKSVSLPTQTVADSPAYACLRYDGTNLRFWNGSVWKTVTLT